MKSIVQEVTVYQCEDCSFKTIDTNAAKKHHKKHVVTCEHENIFCELAYNDDEYAINGYCKDCDITVGVVLHYNQEFFKEIFKEFGGHEVMQKILEGRVKVAKDREQKIHEHELTESERLVFGL